MTSSPPQPPSVIAPNATKRWIAKGALLRERWLTPRNIRAGLSCTATLLAVALPMYLLWFFHRPVWTHGFGYDEQFFTWGGWSITKGLTPYRDFVEYKPPILFLSHALALKAFGFAGFEYRSFFLLLVMFGFGAVTLSLVSRGANKAMTSAVTCAAIFFFSNLAYHDTSYADAESVGYAYYLFGVAFLLARTRFRNVTDALGGAFMTLCFFSKEPFAPCIAATWLAAFVATHGTGDLKKSLTRYAKFTGIGILGVLLALCVYMVPSGAMKAYLQMVASYGRLFRDPVNSYCVLLGRFHPSGSMLGDLPAQWKIINDNFFNLSTFAFLAPAFAASVVFLARRSAWLLGLAALVVAGSLYAVTVSNCYWPHYFTMAQTGIFFFLFLGVDAASPAIRESAPALRAWATVAFVATISAPAFVRYRAEDALWSKVGRIPVPSYGEPISGVLEFVRAHSSPEDRIFTSGAPGLYIVTDRIPATRMSTFVDEVLPAMPGTTDEEKLRERREELVKAMPKIVILDPEHGDRKHRHDRALFQPFLEEFKYERVGPYYYLRPW